MEIETKPGAAAEEVKPVIDAFGVERATDGKPVPVETPAPEKKDEKPKPGETKVETVDDNHPVVKALKDEIKKLSDDKSSMGGNLSEQGKAIAKLTKELNEIKGGKKPGAEPLFKDIKRVKDLPKDKQEEMSDAEKVLFDQLADTHEAMNKLVSDATKEKTDAEAAAEKEGDEAVAAEAFSSTVQKGALALIGIKEGETPSSAQKAMANAIIEEFNAFADNDKLTPTQLAERLAKAAKLVPDYKAPKEQKSPTGAPAKPVDAGSSSEIDKIVEEAAKGKTGGTYSL